MINPEDKGRTPRLGTIELVKATYQTVFSHFVPILSMLWIAILIDFIYVRYSEVLYAPFTSFSDDAGNVKSFIANASVEFMGSLLTLILVSAVAVSLHRLVLLGEKPSLWGVRFGKREINFLLVAFAIDVLLFICTTLPGMVFSGVGAGVGQMFEGQGIVLGALEAFCVLFLMIVGFLLFLRLWLAMPGVALDVESGLKARFKLAWQTADGQTSPLFWGVVLSAAPIWLVVTIASGFLSSDALNTVASSGTLESGMANGETFAELEKSMISMQGVVDVLDVVSYWLMLTLTFIVYSHAYRRLFAGRIPQLENKVCTW